MTDWINSWTSEWAGEGVSEINYEWINELVKAKIDEWTLNCMNEITPYFGLDFLSTSNSFHCILLV